MKKEELIEIIDSWENINLIIEECDKSPTFFSSLMDIALYHKEQKSWRAAYLVDKIHDEFPQLVFPHLDKITEQLKTERNLSKKRHFLKLISMNEIQEKHFGFLVDFCLETLTSEEPPAVRVHAMQVLFNISDKEPDLKPEVLAQIEHEIEYHATAGIISRGKKLVKKLRNQINSL
ncbi:hypothetical protein [Maribellus maritimus]|uniref:hypothetical protein n=1 Tax=Maribellus maritimus TaxID=2870838 RepID=UPI001EEB5EE6|nr:hypothetical protein [Maribellus maritimus]MCG6190123.1 hypothetical protein [Maribellus maritimus]